MGILFWVAVILGIYIALGIGMTVLLSESPYSNNPWWATTLFWPMYIWDMVRR